MDEATGQTALGLEPETAPVRALVAVAIDAAGAAGGHPFTYGVPDRLAPIEPGEAVVVEFGRRQALGIVLGPGVAAPGLTTKPIIDRVRGDGPLLPPLAMRLAAWISDHYLAPPALVLRAMLPPGLLERLELVAERRPDRPGPAVDAPVPDPEEAALLALLDQGPRPVRRLSAPEGRATLLRRLRALVAAGLIDLDWTLSEAAAGPRYVRIARRIAPAPGSIEGADEPRPRVASGRARRQRSTISPRPGPAGIASAELGTRHGASVLASLARRGLVEIEVIEAPRRPLAARAPGRRGARPAATELSPEQAAAVAAIREAIRTGDPTPLLLDGVTGSGKTAIYAEVLATCLDEGRRGLLLVPEIALALPLVDRLRAELDASVALVHSGLGDGERADEWRRIRSGLVDVVVGTRLAVLAPLDGIGLIVVDEEHDGAYKSDRTPRIQARDVAIRLAELAGAAVVLGSATPAVETEGRVADRAVPPRPAAGPPLRAPADDRGRGPAGRAGGRGPRDALAAPRRRDLGPGPGCR